jgi:ketosteroid isomerase-like protein
MSEENVEIVRRLFEAWNAGDMDSFRELYHPDAVMRMAEDWPEPGPYFGREAIMREFEQLRQTWDADAAEPIGDFIDVGDRVAVRHIWRGAGQGPEAAVELTPSGRCVRAASSPRSTTGTTRRRSEPWGCRSR